MGDGINSNALVRKTRGFAKDDSRRSWIEVAITFSAICTGYAFLLTLPGWPIRLALATLVGLLLIRGFVIFHDFQHGSILSDSRLAKGLFYVFGLWVLTPPEVWRTTHNYHHAHTAKMASSHVGSYRTLSVEIYRKFSPMQKLGYRLGRHPLTVLFAYFTVFHIGMCIAPFMRRPRENLDCVWTEVLHIAMIILVYSLFGGGTLFLAFLLPVMIANAAGAYLFYAQHNFEGMHIQPRDDWDYARAALESSSYMKGSRIMQWFTGNIGYHHVHHLNARIPFYRLPEVMEAMEELQNPGTTSLSPREIIKCFRLKLWDPEQGKMVGYSALD